MLQQNNLLSYYKPGGVRLPAWLQINNSPRWAKDSNDKKDKDMEQTMQIPVTIPNGISRQSINVITEQITMYAQFLFSQAKQEYKYEGEPVALSKTKCMTKHEARQFLDSISIKGVNVPVDVNGMRDICNTKYL